MNCHLIILNTSLKRNNKSLLTIFFWEELADVGLFWKTIEYFVYRVLFFFLTCRHLKAWKHIVVPMDAFACFDQKWIWIVWICRLNEPGYQHSMVMNYSIVLKSLLQLIKNGCHTQKTPAYIYDPHSSMTM